MGCSASSSLANEADGGNLKGGRKRKSGSSRSQNYTGGSDESKTTAEPPAPMLAWEGRAGSTLGRSGCQTSDTNDGRCSEAASAETYLTDEGKNALDDESVSLSDGGSFCYDSMSGSSRRSFSSGLRRSVSGATGAAPISGPLAISTSMTEDMEPYIPGMELSEMGTPRGSVSSYGYASSVPATPGTRASSQASFSSVGGKEGGSARRSQSVTFVPNADYDDPLAEPMACYPRGFARSFGGSGVKSPQSISHGLRETNNLNEDDECCEEIVDKVLKEGGSDNGEAAEEPGDGGGMSMQFRIAKAKVSSFFMSYDKGFNFDFADVTFYGMDDERTPSELADYVRAAKEGIPLKLLQQVTQWQRRVRPPIPRKQWETVYGPTATLGAPSITTSSACH